MTPIHKTLQDGRPEPLGLLPWPYSHEPGQIYIIEYKRSGKVVRVEKWKLVAYVNSGEKMHRWVPHT